MGQFDLTSTLDPTDEQLQALMEGVGEIGRRSHPNAVIIIEDGKQRMISRASAA